MCNGQVSWYGERNERQNLGQNEKRDENCLSSLLNYSKSKVCVPIYNKEEKLALEKP